MGESERKEKEKNVHPWGYFDNVICFPKVVRLTRSKVTNDNNVATPLSVIISTPPFSSLFSLYFVKYNLANGAEYYLVTRCIL